jgi:AraC-like DNA-binding protein
LFFSTFRNIEEYKESFKYLDAELNQLSKGSFDSSISTYIHGNLVLDRRVTEASHIHQCVIQMGVINFVFINSFGKLNINGLDIDKDSQIAVSENEVLSAIIQGKLDITTVSISIDQLLRYTSLDILKSGSIDGAAIRNGKFSLIHKSNFHMLVNRYIEYLKFNKKPSDQVLIDMEENIGFQLSEYLESHYVIHSTKKKKLSTQELNRIHELIINTDVLSLNSLQSICNCSPRTLTNLIQKHFECTPNQLVSIIRLNRINRYLSEYSPERKSIKHICEKFGVHSQHRLSKSFQELFGQSIQDALKERTKQRVHLSRM